MKKKIKINNRRAQRGVALLFALGILSLLLILGLASVTNALLAQRVASNNSSRSQAKMLAQSAISRMAISLMYYQYGAKDNPSVSYEGIFSCYDANAETADRSSTPQACDGLRGSDSKLIPPGGLTNYDFASDLKGEWSYVTAKDADNHDRIVGRVAYQLLPTSQSAQINLDHLLRGIYSQGTPARTPWTDRWGAGINELNLNETTVFKNWETEAPAASSDLTASTFDAFFSAFSGSLFSADTAKKEAWVRRWFAEGTVAADPEYYRYYDSTAKESYYYHRFPLGTLDSSRGTISDAWYDRLTVGYSANSANPNSESILGRLAGPSPEFKITDSVTGDKMGLPYLKNISDIKGSFSDLTSRRKQITANLNDYCDSDSVPSSNVEASTWGGILSNSTSWPKYTGNEKTPYINELAFGFKATPSLKSGSGTMSAYNLTVNMKLDKAELIAELIKIYQTLDNENKYQLLARLSSLKIGFKVTVNGTVTYTDSDGSNPGSVSVTGVSKENATAVSYASQLVTVDFNPSSDAPAWTNGYLVFAQDLTAPGTTDCDLDFTSFFNTAAPGGKTITGATIDEVKVEIVKPEFSMGGVALMDVADSANQFGVDFIRWTADPLPEDDKTLQLFKHSDIPGAIVGTSGAGWIKGSSLGSIPECFHHFYLGGMEAKDPRQNLFATNTTDTTLTDWSLFTNIDLVDFDNVTPAKKLTMNIPVPASADQNTEQKVKDRIVAGLVNTDGNPNTKVTGGTGSYDANHDIETAIDPAWIGTAADKHLSTAFIRNAPMESPWELGAIHRAAAWETINLKNAMSPGSTTAPVTPEDMDQHEVGNGWTDSVGTSYAGGDGGILEQVKMTDRAYCYGKLNVNMLSSSKVVNPDYTSWDDEMGQSLFFNLRYGQNLDDLSNLTTPGGTQITWSNTSVVVAPLKGAVAGFRSAHSGYGDAFENRAQFLCWKDGSDSLANGFGILSAATWAELPDARQEELVGKTIDLLKTNNSITNTIKFIVVAQTIRDLDGTVARIKNDGSVGTKSCTYGTFDVETDTSDTSLPVNDQFTYYDQIAGEVKMLVTMENNPTTGQTIVRQVEYIE